MNSRSARTHNGAGRPESRPSSRSRARLDHISSQEEALSPLPPPGSASLLHPPGSMFSGVYPPTPGLGQVVETIPLSIQFTASGHSNRMLTALNEMRLNNEQCDVTIRVETDQLAAHKLVLSANSPYFRAMFSSNYSEATQSKVEILGVTSVALELLVQYFYTSKIHISTENVQDILAASTMLQASRVTDACCEFMRRHLGVSNCLGVQTFADMHSCSELKRMASEFTKSNFVIVVESEDFLKLELDQVLELFSASDLVVASEANVFEACVRWIKFDPANRDKFIVDLLEKVRLPLLSPSYLLDTVHKTSVVSENLRAVMLVVEALEMHLLPDRKESRQSSDWLKPRSCNSKFQIILAVGGMGRREPAGTPSIERYDPSIKQWQILSQMASGRWGAGLAAMTTTDGEEVVYLVGGSNESSRLSSVQKYTVSNDMWSSVKDMSFARNGVGVVTYEGVLYAIGGFDGMSPLKSMESYNPSTNQWTILADMATKRFGLGACAIEGLIYAMGGQDSSILNSAECYNIFTATWNSIASMSMCRKFPGAECLSRRIFVMGGTDASHSRLSSVEEYIPSLDQWVVVNPMLSPRSGLGTAVLGGYIYVVGGHDGSAPLSTMERYDPLVNEWSLQPHMTVSRDCVGTAVVGMSLNACSPPPLHGMGGANSIARTSPTGISTRSDSPVIRSNV